MTSSNPIQKRDFNADAAAWDENPMRLKLSADIATEMERRVDFTSEMDAMDFGCGTGLITLALAPRVRKMLGLDSSVGMLDVLSAKISEKGLSHVETRHFDLEAEGDISLRFDRIVSAMTLHHIPDIAALFQRWFSWLNPGGRIAAADLDKEDGGFHPDNTGVFHFGFERSAVATALEFAGFTEISFSDAASVSRPRDNGRTDVYPVFLVTAKKPGTK